MKPTLLLALGSAGLTEASARYFRDRRYTVATAADGLECLGKLRHLLPDILVLDQHLLWGGGDGVLALLRREPRLPPVPVILQVDVPFAGMIAPPVVATLLKPVRMRELVAKVEYVELLLREQLAGSGAPVGVAGCPTRVPALT